MNGNIVILNGTSSSGKTTLARAFQTQCDEVYLLCSLDAFWDMTPYNIAAGSTNFPNMKLALAKSVRALVETGHNVIVDLVFCGNKTYQELTKELAGLQVCIVKVDCPIEELTKREAARGDRGIGLAASQYESIHDGAVYDLTINTLTNTPEQGAQQIIEQLKKCRHQPN
jgi:chloramphenicol 3-O phosphotransferase